MTHLRTPRDTRTASEISQDHFGRILRALIGASIILLAGWFYVVAHFIVKFW